MKQYICSRCKKVFFHKHTFLRHDEKVLDCATKKKKKSQILKCGECDYTTGRGDHMKIHLDRHKKEMAREHITALQGDNIPKREPAIIIMNRGDNANGVLNNVGGNMGDINNAVQNNDMRSVNIANQLGYLSKFVHSYDSIPNPFSLSEVDICDVFLKHGNPFVRMFDIIYCNAMKPSFQCIKFVDENTVKIYNDGKWFKKQAVEIFNDVLKKEEEWMSLYAESSMNHLADNLFKAIKKALLSVKCDMNDVTVVPEILRNRFDIMKYMMTSLEIFSQESEPDNRVNVPKNVLLKRKRILRAIRDNTIPIKKIPKKEVVYRDLLASSDEDIIETETIDVETDVIDANKEIEQFILASMFGQTDFFDPTSTDEECVTTNSEDSLFDTSSSIEYC